MLDRRFTCVRLSHPYMTWSIHAFDHNVHHRGHCAAAACGSLKPLPAERLRGTFPHLSYSMKLALLLLGTTEGPTFIFRTAGRFLVFLTQPTLRSSSEEQSLLWEALSTDPPSSACVALGFPSLIVLRR